MSVDEILPLLSISYSFAIIANAVTYLNRNRIDTHRSCTELNGISVNTLLSVKVNILWCVNFGVVKL